MTNAQPLDILPKEVDSFIESRVCPLCQSELVSDTTKECYALSLGNGKEYAAWTPCKQDPSHYSLNFGWQDPKHISLSDEEIVVYHDDKEYKITKIYDDMPPETISFIVKIFQLDECGSIVNPEVFITVYLKAGSFDFENFNIEKAVSLIKTMVIFK